MSESATSERYQLKITLRGISPLIWRRVVVSSDTTLAELHEEVQVTMGWRDEHLHRFHIHGQDHGLAKIGTAGYGNPHGLRLHDLRLRVRERFLYEYNFHAPWEHDLRVEHELPAEPKRPWPVCTGGRRACPPEQCYGAASYLRWLETRYSTETMWSLEEAAQTVGRIVLQKLDTDETLTEDERYELQEAALVLEDYGDFDPEQFDRKAVNKALKEGWQTRWSSISKS